MLAALAEIVKRSPWRHAASRDDLLRVDQYRAIAALGPDAIPVLLGAATAGTRLHVAWALALFDDPRAAAQLDLWSQSNDKVTIRGR